MTGSQERHRQPPGAVAPYMTRHRRRRGFSRGSVVAEVLARAIFESGFVEVGQEVVGSVSPDMVGPSSTSPRPCSLVARFSQALPSRRRARPVSRLRFTRHTRIRRHRGRGMTRTKTSTTQSLALDRTEWASGPGGREARVTWLIPTYSTAYSCLSIVTCHLYRSSSYCCILYKNIRVACAPARVRVRRITSRTEGLS